MEHVAQGRKQTTNAWKGSQEEQGDILACGWTALHTAEKTLEAEARDYTEPECAVDATNMLSV